MKSSMFASPSAPVAGRRSDAETEEKAPDFRNPPAPFRNLEIGHVVKKSKFLGIRPSSVCGFVLMLSFHRQNRHLCLSR